MRNEITSFVFVVVVIVVVVVVELLFSCPISKKSFPFLSTVSSLIR